MSNTSGTSGSDNLNGGSGSDIIDGGTGSDRVSGGSGDDVLDGGAGSDTVSGDSGDDTLVYVVRDNAGSTDVYDGGSGIDTIKLVMTRQEWMNPTFQADLARYLSFLNAQINPINEQAKNTEFRFAAFDLRVSKFEKIVVVVDGVQIRDLSDQAVVLRADSVSTDEDHSSLAFDVLQNDSVPDLVQAITFTNGAHGTVAWAAGQPVLSASSSPAQAKLIYTPDTSYYQHLAVGQSVTDTFTYTVTDADGDVSTATVTVTITGTNDGPVAVADTASGTENETLPIDVLANDTDLDDGHVFTLTAAAAPTGKGTASIVDNRLVFTPGTDFDHLASGVAEVVTLTYTMQDDQGASSSSTVTVTITGTNDGPVAVADTASGTENEALTIDVLANDTDLDDGHVFTLTAAAAPTGKGSASISGNRLVFAPGNAFDHLPAGATEVVTLSYTMQDDQGASSSSTVTVTITGTNDGPVAVADTASGTENEALTIDVLANDTDLDDGHVFTLTAAAAPTGKGSASISGNRLVFAPGNAFDHLPAGATEVVTLNYAMKDEHGAESSSTVTITVTGTNDAPVVSGPLAGAATEDGAAVAFDGLANAGDVDDGAVLAVQPPATLPAGVTFDSATNSFRLDPANAAYQSLALGATTTVTVNYAVTDGTASTPASVSWTVTGTNDSPMVTWNAAAATGSVVEAGSTVAGTATATGALASSDVDAGATASWSGDSDGIYGSFAIDAQGVWTYTLDDSRAATEALAPGQTVSESFTATVTDEHGATAQQTITIQVAGSEDNRAPTAEDVSLSGTSGLPGGSGVAIPPYNGGSGMIFTRLVDSNGDGVADTPDAPSTLSGGYGTGLATGDIDGDGDVDMVSINGGQIWTYTNAGDTNGDGRVDFVSTQAASAGNGSQDVGLTDLNGDGKLDIVVSSFGTLTELINRGDSNGNGLIDDFTSRSVSTGGSAGYTYGIATGDLDGDGLADIVIPNYEASYYGGHPVTVMFNRGDTDGDGQIDYVAQGLYPGTTSAMGASIGDLNGDGRADLVISRWDGQGVQVMLGLGDTNGDGQIEFAVSNVAISDHVMETTLADLDGDGDLDLASSGANGHVHISLNQGDTDGDGGLNFTTTDYYVGYGTYGLAVTDLDGDGDLDVFAPNQSGYWNGNTASYLNNLGDSNGDGAPEFNLVQVTNVPSGWDAEPLDVGVGGGSGAREDGPVVTGSFVGDDADAGDSEHLTFEMLSQPAEGSVVNNGDGTFGFDPGTDFQDLALGESRTVTFTYRAVDPHGAASAPATVTVTVAGKNDAPIVTSNSAAASGSVTEAGNLDDGTVAPGTATTGGNLTSSDVDNGATSTWSAATTLEGTYGTFSIDSAGHWTYALDNSRPATQALAAGAEATEHFTARVTDDKGAKAEQVVTVTVHGTNDSPVAVADLSGNGGGEGATALGAPFLVNTLTQNYQGQSAVTGLSAGGFVVSYNSAAQFNGYQGIALQRFDASGAKVGGEISVAGSYGNYASNSAVTALSNGGFAVSWAQNGDGNNQDYENTFVQLYDAQGVAVGSPVQVNSTIVYSQYQPSVSALAGGGFIVTFNDNSAYAGSNYNQATDIRAQIFSSTGTKVGSEFIVNSNVNGDQYQSQVVTLASGNFVVAWQDSGSGNSNIQGQMFTASGQRVGGTMTLGNVADGSSKNAVSLTALPNGGFVAAFSSYRYDGTQNYDDVHATVFDSSGNQVGTELVINTISIGGQYQPAISALSDGSFVIVWVDNSAYYGSPDYNRAEDVKGQLVAADGTLVGGEFTVGTSPQGGQYEPSITTLAGGDIVVTWTDNSNSYGDNDSGVIAQIYAFDKNEENEIVTIDVLENDGDVDSGATFSLVSVTQPAKGSVAIVDDRIVFDPGTAFDHLAKNARETVTVSYVMQDEHGATSTATTTIIVTGTNDAPVVSGPVTGTAAENGSADTLDAFAKASDLDDNAAFTAVIGTLPGAVTYSAATHSFSLNTNHASLQSLAPGETATVTVSYGISDGTATTPATASWTVIGTYDAPVVTGAVSGSATEDGAPSTLNALANAAAIDHGSTLSVVNVPATLPAGVTYNEATRSFTLNPADPAYQSLSQGQTTTVSVTYGVTDGTTTIDDTVKWTVTGTNDTPTVSGAVTGTATEDGATVTLAALTGAADVDSSATLSVTGIGALPSGVTFDAATQSFTLNPANAAYQSLAAGATTTVTVNYRVTDGTSSVPQTASWVVTGTNDAPVVSGAATATATEDSAVSVVNARAQASDADAGNTLTVVDVPAALPAGVTYNAANQTFSLNPADSAYQSLAPGETTTVLVNYGVSDGIVTTAASARWTVTGTNDAPRLDLDVPAPTTNPTAIDQLFTLNGSAAQVATDLVRLTTDTTTQSGSAFSIQKLDFSQSMIFDFDIYVGSHDNPGADGIAMVLHNDPRGATATGGYGIGLGVSGIQNGLAIEFDTYQNTGEPAQDHTSIMRSSTFTSVTAVQQLGNIEDGQFHRVVVTWNAATQTLSYTIDGIARGSLTGDLVNQYFGGSDTVFFGFTGGTGGEGNLQQVRINSITGVLADATPVYPTYTENGAAVALTGLSVAVDDLGERDLTSLKITIGGVQDGSAERLTLGSATVQLGSNSSGSVTVAGEAFTYAYVASTRVLTITASDGRIAPAALETLIETMTYADATEAPTAGSRTFAFVVTDASGATSATQTARIDVVAVNDAPAGADRTLTATEDTALTLTTANFALADVDGNALGAVKIATLPGAGSLTLNGTAVTAGQLVSAADIAAGKLVFTPATNANGTGYASFTFQVQDNGGTANGGQNTDPSPNTMTLNVTAVNDPVTGLSLSANATPENVPGVVVGLLSASDADTADTLTYTIRPGLDASLFTVVGNELRVGGTGLDYEQATTRQVTVRATDAAGSFFDRTFTIQVLDSNEFTLTTANDAFTSGSTNDQVLANSLTLNAGDKIATDGGADELLLFGSGSFNLGSLDTYSGVETVRLINLTTGTATLVLRGGVQNDVLASGTGNTNVTLNDLAGVFTGSDGQDVVSLGTGTATVNTGNNSDTVHHYNGAATINTGDLNDTIYLGNGLASVNAGTASDSIYIDQNGFNALQTVDGGANFDTLYVNGTRDLTGATLTNLEALTLQGSANATMTAAQLAQFTQIGGSVTARLTVGDAAVDLSNKTIGNVTVYSANAAGTLFTVTSAASAMQIVGGVGNDTLQLTGAALTADQRDVLFAVSSIETLIDSSGTYTAPAPVPGLIRLTTGVDVLPAGPDSLTVNATAATLNTGDTLNAGATGTDVLAIYGTGTFNMNSYNATGFEEIRLINNTTAQATVTLRNNEVVTFTATGTGSVFLQTGNLAATITTSTGSDNIYAYSASTVSTGAGNDQVLLGNGQSTVNAGDDNDQILYDWLGYNAAHSLNGGNGYDTLHVNGARDLTGATLQNFESLQINNAVRLSAAQVAQFQSLGGGGRLTFGESTVDLLNKSVNVAVLSDNATGTTFKVNSAAAALQIVGGAGNDTIDASTITLSASDRAAIFAVTSIETIVDATGTYAAPTLPEGTIKLTLGVDNLPASPDSLTVNASVVTLSAGDNLNAGNTGTDVLALYGSGTFNLGTPSTLTGFEQVTLTNNGSQLAYLYLRSGMVTTLTTGGTQSAYVMTSDAALTVTMGATNDYINMQGAGTVTGSTGGGNDVFYTNSALATIDLGDGNDSVQENGGFNAVNALIGGLGFDSITLSTGRDLTGASLSGFESLYLNNASGTWKMTGAQAAQFQQLYGQNGAKVTTADAAFDIAGKYTAGLSFLSDNAAGTTFKVSGSAQAFQVVGGGGQDIVENIGTALSVDQRTALLNGASVEILKEGNLFYGGSGSNHIDGNAGSNTIYGNGGDDVIDGGAGADLLYGGEGDDVFQFHAGQANGDTILDFSGNGAGAGDTLTFEGFGTVAAGATFVQVDATHWQVNSADGTLHEMITVTAGTTFHPADILFI
jgi:VCBS repeat-containing protein